MADVFSLDKLSIKKLKALAGRNNVSLRGCFEKSDILKTLRDAGVKEHSGPPPATSSSNEATPRHAQQYNATVPGQAYTSAYSSPMPSARKPRSKEADLQALSISQLKRVARERRIDTSHCFEKADLIAALRPPPEPTCSTQQHDGRVSRVASRCVACTFSGNFPVQNGTSLLS